MEHEKQKISLRLLFSIALISASLFMYEVILSHLFSVLLSYHYVFLVISMSILGMGLGSFIEYKHINKEYKCIDEKMIKLFIRLSLIMLISFWVIYFLPFISTTFYIVISIIPYFFAGRLLTTIFLNYGEYSNRVYFADLIGAGIAAIGSITFLFALGFIPSVFVLFIMLFSNIFLLDKARKFKMTQLMYGVLIVPLIVAIYIPEIEQWFDSNFIAYLTSPNTSLQRFRNANYEYEIIYSQWDGFARTDVVKVEDDSLRIVTINGSSNASMLRWDGREESVAYLKKDIGMLPYLIGDVENVAIIGAGGGKEVLQALIGGAEQIDAIEINQSAINAVKSMGEYNGYLYEEPKVNVVVGDGRSILANSNKKYDIIFASLVMTGTSEAGYAMAESYIYTEEAFNSYYEHLKPNGRLVFISHDTEDMYKIINTVYTTLLNNDISSNTIKDRVIVGAESMNHGSYKMLSTPLVIVKKDNQFKEEEINTANQFFEDNNIEKVHLSDLNDKSYVTYLADNENILQDVIEKSQINVKPASDNSPYFYNFNKGVPNSLLIILGAILLFLVPFLVLIRKENGIKLSIHFSLLGIVFMLVEVAFIQTLTLYLEHPTTAFTTVIASLLIGAGIGSYFSNHKYWLTKGERHKGALGAVLSLSLSMLLFWRFKTDFLGISIWVKIILSIIVLAGNGFFMGMLFPYSIQKLKLIGEQNLIPLLYGVNGIFSVLGSVTAIILSMQIGINTVLILGICIYLTIYLFMPKVFKS